MSNAWREYATWIWDLSEDLPGGYDGGVAALGTVRRKICERLLVKFGELPPKLASYAGKGSRGSWVRIFAMREAQKLAAQGPPS